MSPYISLYPEYNKAKVDLTTLIPHHISLHLQFPQYTVVCKSTLVKKAITSCRFYIVKYAANRVIQLMEIY